jgi:hypothetical protein
MWLLGVILLAAAIAAGSLAWDATPMHRRNNPLWIICIALVAIAAIALMQS